MGERMSSERLEEVGRAIGTAVIDAEGRERRLMFVASAEVAAIMRFDQIRRVIPDEEVASIRTRSGQRSIRLRNGSSIDFLTARSHGYARGYSLDYALVDTDVDGDTATEFAPALVARNGQRIDTQPL